MKLTDTHKPLTDKAARELGKAIAKESNTVRIKFGKTNGRNVLYVFVPGKNDLGYTIQSYGEWELHPANDKIKRNNDFVDIQETEQIIESNRGERLAV